MYRYGRYCPVASAVEILGERWTLLIVRDLLTGTRHFNDLERGLPGISRALLSERLRRLQQAGILEKECAGADKDQRLRMTNVFVGGSRETSSLSQAVQLRLDNIMRDGYTVLIGDANGVDRAVQKYLQAAGYAKVVVYCSGQGCRNNAGNWPTQHISTGRRAKDFAFYAAKDAAMAEAADYGFMIWNGRSAGSLNNLLNLLKHEKSTLVYLVPQNQFHSLSDLGALAHLLRSCDPRDLQMFERKLNLSKIVGQAPDQESPAKQLELTSE